MSVGGLTSVRLLTSRGAVDIVVYCDRAPLSAQAFLQFVDDGTLSRHGAFYRAVRAMENDHGSPVINVLQGGWLDPPASLVGIPHETTLGTGLRHLDGTVSLARRTPGSATGAAFFICIGDQPVLDCGGGRDPFGDGLGFAAFGRVTAGMQAVCAIHGLPTTGVADEPYARGQILDPPVRILDAHRRDER